MITEEIATQIRGHANESLPREACGFILFNRSYKIFKARNTRQDQTSFSINCLDYVSASSEGEIVGVYHSQPSKEFSVLDKTNSFHHNLPFILYSVEENCFDTFGPKDYIPPYVGVDFKIGVNDCYSLARRYYRQELNLELKDYSRNEEYLFSDSNLFEKHFQDEGFVAVAQNPNITIDQIKRHDAILFKNPEGVNSCHVAIYVEANRILHHPRNQFSRYQTLKNCHLKKISYILRNKMLL